MTRCVLCALIVCTIINYVYYDLLDIILTEFIMKESKKTSSKDHEKNGLFILIGMTNPEAFLKCILKSALHN